MYEDNNKINLSVYIILYSLTILFLQLFVVSRRLSLFHIHLDLNIFHHSFLISFLTASILYILIILSILLSFIQSTIITYLQNHNKIHYDLYDTAYEELYRLILALWNSYINYEVSEFHEISDEVKKYEKMT